VLQHHNVRVVLIRAIPQRLPAAGIPDGTRVDDGEAALIIRQ